MSVQLYQYGNTKQVTNFNGGLDRQAVCNPFSIFEYKSDSPYQIFFNQIITGAGSSFVRDATESLIKMTADAGGRVLSTSNRYIYDSGSALQEYVISFTFSEGSPVVGCEYRVGAYDNPSDMVGTPNIQANGGHYLRYDTVNGLAVVERQITAIAPFFVDTVVLQSSFNRDTLDGNGPSKVIFDPEESYTLSIRRDNWGTGYVEFSLYRTSDYPSDRIPFHRIEHFSQSKPYIKSAKNPVTYELINGGSTNAVMYQTDSAVSNFGAGIPSAKITPFRTTQVTLGAGQQVMFGARLKANRIRSTFFISKIQVFGSGWGTQECMGLKMILNPIITGSPVWIDPDILSSVEVTETTGLSFSGGRTVRDYMYSGRIVGLSTTNMELVDLPLVSAFANGTSFEVWLVAEELFGTIADVQMVVSLTEFI